MILKAFTFMMVIFILKAKEHSHDYEIDVRCGKRGINVRIAFKEHFLGMIFSKGFYYDQSCRYFEDQIGTKITAFTIPFSSCGTEFKLNGLQMNVSNTIVIQHNLLVETWRDADVFVSCESSFLIKENSTDNTKGIQSSVMAWLEFKRENNTENSVVYVGEKLLANIYVRDDDTFNDIHIKNCKAQSALNHTTSTKVLQLIDEFGCVLVEKFITGFNVSTLANGNFKASSFLNVFRFTDQDELFIICEIEICKDVCDSFCSKNDYRSYNSSVGRPLTRRSLSSPNINFVTSERSSTNKLMQLTMNTILQRMRVERTKNTERVERNLIIENVPLRMHLNVVKKLKVLPLKTEINMQADSSLKLEENCFSRTRFTVLTVFLSLIILCLLIINVFMTFHIRSEKKRTKINNFLLYSYK